MTMIRLRYTGARAATFQEPGVGYVEPDGEFAVDESRLLSFMRRADIEHAGDCPAPPCRCGEEPRPEPAAEASEDASRSQDGDTTGGSPSGKRGRSGSPSGKKDTGEQ